MKERQNMSKRKCAGEQVNFRRDKACARDNVKVTREHEGEIRECARDTCMRSGNMKER
jgi:hypothetical protein